MRLTKRQGNWILGLVIGRDDSYYDLLVSQIKQDRIIKPAAYSPLRLLCEYALDAWEWGDKDNEGLVDKGYAERILNKLTR